MRRDALLERNEAARIERQKRHKELKALLLKKPKPLYLRIKEEYRSPSQLSMGNSPVSNIKEKGFKSDAKIFSKSKKKLKNLGQKISSNIRYLFLYNVNHL